MSETRKCVFFLYYLFSVNKTLHNAKRERVKYNIYKMKLGLFLFLIGIYGLILNRRNLILMIISLELILLAVTLLILFSSYNSNDLFGQIYALYIIAIAGCEAAIGLSILIVFYRLRGTIAIKA